MAIVLHSALVFFLVWIVVRVVGKREMSQLSAFDFVILVVMGDLVAETVVGEDTSITGAVISVATFALLTVFLSWLSFRFSSARRLLEGRATLLIKDGELLEEAMTIERLDITDLHEAARKQGFSDLDDVAWAVIEQDGSFSFFGKDKNEATESN